MVALYNEIDPFAAQWLRHLIVAGHIAPGIVVEDSIEDLHPNDLRPFHQVHLFAGIGVWSYALRRIGWPDDARIWTGSCPCQPFSAAGKGGGFVDERHLWPHFHHLVGQCRPPIVVGEQVASKDGLAWLDLVQADMEGSGYAFGAVDTCAAGVGAPHIRQRLYWIGKGLADAQGGGWPGEPVQATQRSSGGDEGHGEFGGLAHADGGDTCTEWQQRPSPATCDHEAPGRFQEPTDAPGLCGDFRLAHTEGIGEPHQSERNEPGFQSWSSVQFRPNDGTNGGTGSGGDPSRSGTGGAVSGETFGLGPTLDRPGPTNGLWRDADWLYCRDGKWRPVEPRPQPMVDGSAESLGRVCPDQLAQIQEEVNAIAMETESLGAETVQLLWQYLVETAQRSWPTGRIPGLHEAPFLLAFVRQLQTQGWAIPKGDALPCPQAAAVLLRELWGHDEIAGAPHQRGLDGQPARKYPDIVHILSSLLACHAHTAWFESYRTYAEIGFPLHHKAKSRVGRLRGYGNAINAEQAAHFLEAALMT